MEFSKAYELVIEKLETWLNTAIEMLPNLVVALLVMGIFYGLGKLARRLINRALNRVTRNKTIINLFETIIGLAVFGLGIFIALGILKLEGAVTSLLAGAGIIGLALGFAFQDIVAQFMSGIMLSVRHPFGIGDVIKTNDFYGTVKSLNLRNTIIHTPEGQKIFVPNKSVFDNPLTNYTFNKKRRVDLGCGISYGDDLDKVKKTATKALDKLKSKQDNTDVEIYFEEFGGSSINFIARFWIDFTKPVHYKIAVDEAIIALKKAFDKEDIMIPYPIRTLDFGIRGGEKLDTMIASKKK